MYECASTKVEIHNRYARFPDDVTHSFADPGRITKDREALFWPVACSL
jgi:hypothetical protein